MEEEIGQNKNLASKKSEIMEEDFEKIASKQKKIAEMEKKVEEQG